MGNICQNEHLEKDPSVSFRRLDSQNVFSIQSKSNLSDVNSINLIELSEMDEIEDETKINSYKSTVMSLLANNQHSPPDSMKTTSMNNAAPDAVKTKLKLKEQINDIQKLVVKPKKEFYGPIFYENERSTYEGQYTNGQRNGLGTIVYGDGSVYYGFWKSDKKDGQGIFIFNNGNYFVGTFKEDMPDGEG